MNNAAKIISPLSQCFLPNIIAKIIQVLTCLNIMFFTSLISAQSIPDSSMTTTEENITTEFVFEIKAKIDERVVNGPSVGGTRQAIPITGGTFKGPSITGTVIPGGADYQLIREDGVIEIKAIYMIKTDDDVIINVVNSGLGTATSTGRYLRAAPQFTAPTGKYDWLNKALFVSSIAVNPKEPGFVTIRVYKVL